MWHKTSVLRCFINIITIIHEHDKDNKKIEAWILKDDENDDIRVVISVLAVNIELIDRTNFNKTKMLKL